MKIMVCYGATDSNSKIIEKAKVRAKESDASILLLSVLVGSDVGQLDGLDAAKEDLAKVKVLFEAENISCKADTMFGGATAGESIVERAEQESVDEIIIGVKKKSKIGKFIFGSDTQYVILEAHCPVLTVKI